MDGRGECLTGEAREAFHLGSARWERGREQGQGSFVFFFFFLPPAYFPLSFTPLQLVRGASFLEKGA